MIDEKRVPWAGIGSYFLMISAAGICSKSITEILNR